MLSYRLLWVGRRARDPLLAAAEDYRDRLAHYAKIELWCCKASDPAGEARELKKRIRPQDHLVVLDERGSQLTTRELVTRIDRWGALPQPNVTLVVGGAGGLDPSLSARARESLALSKLTLPHRLALVLLCEQLYRAHTIMRGEPYHRDG